MVSKESTSQCRKCGFNPWVRKITCNRNWQPTPTVFLPGKAHVQRSLMGYGLEGLQESDMTEHRCAFYSTEKPILLILLFFFAVNKDSWTDYYQLLFLFTLSFRLWQICPESPLSRWFLDPFNILLLFFFFSLSTSSFSDKHVSESSYTFPVPLPESAISPDYCISF